MVNNVTLIGNLGADPEVKTTANGMQVCNLRVATTERRKQGDTWAEHTEWHRVVCFGKTAENVGKYCKKGKQLYITGSIRTTSYEKDGQKHYSTEVVANDVRFLGGSGANEGKPRMEEGAIGDSEIPF